VEIGCGAGEILSQIRSAIPEASRCEGWDVSPQAIALCRVRERAGLKFFQGDFLSSHEAEFDLVLCLDVFEHIADYLGFLCRLRSKGRRFVFHVPLDMSVQAIIRLSPIRKARAQLGHLHYFTKETALATLESAGYVIDEWSYSAGSLELPDQSVLQRLARIPRRLGLMTAPDLTVRVLGGCSLLVLAR
jgi:SAM-dependent methyltransferase